MAFVNTPRTWSTGELVTASFMNGLRDALNELSRAVLTTAGDMLYASSATVSARLAIGAAGTFLTPSGGAPAWSNTVSAGTDANTVISVGSGGSAPTAQRYAKLDLNAPSSGGNLGT